MTAAPLLAHGLSFGLIAFSPRVWGYRDYPDAVKRKIPAQTGKEKPLAAIMRHDDLNLVLEADL
jgi:hypothetical protein